MRDEDVGHKPRVRGIAWVDDVLVFVTYGPREFRALWGGGANHYSDVLVRRQHECPCVEVVEVLCLPLVIVGSSADVGDVGLRLSRIPCDAAVQACWNEFLLPLGARLREDRFMLIRPAQDVGQAVAPQSDVVTPVEEDIAAAASRPSCTICLLPAAYVNLSESFGIRRCHSANNHDAGIPTILLSSE